jgi:hypothetical protein
VAIDEVVNVITMGYGGMTAVGAMAVWVIVVAS